MEDRDDEVEDSGAAVPTRIRDAARRAAVSVGEESWCDTLLPVDSTRRREPGVVEGLTCLGAIAVNRWES